MLEPLFCEALLTSGFEHLPSVQRRTHSKNLTSSRKLFVAHWWEKAEAQVGNVFPQTVLSSSRATTEAAIPKKLTRPRRSWTRPTNSLLRSLRPFLHSQLPAVTARLPPAYFQGGLWTTFIQQNQHRNPGLSTAEQGQRNLLSLHRDDLLRLVQEGHVALLTCGGSTIQPLIPSPSASTALLEISKELDFPVGVGQRTKQTGYLCLGCFRLSKKPQLLDQISTYKHSSAQNIISPALGIYHPGRDSSAHFTASVPRELDAPELFPSKLSLLLRESALEANYTSHEGGDHFPEAKNHASCSTSPQGCSRLG